MPSDPRQTQTSEPDDIEILHPRRVRNQTFHVVGLLFMALNLVRHKVRGYRTPRPRVADDAKDALTYDRAVVNNWLHYLARHTGDENGVRGLDVLEIGPGPDLGTGMLMLAEGAESYLAVDSHPLLTRTSRDQHRALAQAIEQTMTEDEPISPSSALERFLAGEPSPLRYRYLPGFDLSELEDDSVDLVVSHSVFEHLDDVKATIQELGRITRAGGHFVAEVDLQTHTRWIRDADPLNVYRYPRHLYRAMSFSGAPNRFRPDQYLNAFDSEGWASPRIFPRRVLDPSYVESIEPALCPRFRGDPEQLGWLSIVITATRRAARRKRKPASHE